MSHFNNSGSEDGQLRSPGDDYYSDEDDQVETADSLDIKPPQAARISSSSGRKKSGKEKKHSREHKHKERDRGDRERTRDHMMRDRQKDRGSGGGSSGGGNIGSSGMDERRHRHYIRDNRDRRNHHRDYYDRNKQQQQQQQQQHHQQDYYSRHKHSRDKRMDRDVQERDRRKIIDQQYENQDDAEKALEDLRTRLISKRHKLQEHSTDHYENVSNRLSNINRIDRSEMVEQHTERSEKTQQHRREKEQRERKDHIIEVIDSPEHFSDYSSSTRGKEKEKKIMPEHLEQAARRAKLLEAEREMARRKEVAREELEARREKRRVRGEIMSTSPLSQSEKVKLTKRHHDHTHRDILKSRKRLKKSHEEGEYEENEIFELSDNSETDEEDEVQDSETESESDNHSSEKSEKKHRNKSPNEDDEVLPGSPLSVGDLSKSEHRKRSPKSHSRSPSVVSHRSHTSHSERSKSANSHLLSRSPSESHSRSLTRSRSRSRSRSKSRSRSHSRSHTRSRSRSRSLSVDKKRQIDEDDDIEMKDVSKSNKNVKEKEYEKKDVSGDRKKTASKNEDNNDADDNDVDDDDSPKDEKKEKLPNYYPAIQGCRSVDEFQYLNRIEEGTYGIVYRAKDKRTNEIVALKRLKMEKEKEGFPITSLREINTLLKGQHPNIVTVREIVVGSNMDKIFIVMDYVEHDLKSLMETMKHKEQSFFPGEIKCLTQQLLRAVAHLHDNWILHRDLKTSNLLLSHKGILKVGDFGLAREYGSPLKQYTSLVVTLWYRAPELLLCSKEYSTPIDMWSVGCIFAEFLQMGPLFPGKSEIDQLNRIFKELGTPNEKIWPGYKDLPAVQNLLSQNSHFTEYPVSNLRKRFLNKATELGLNLLQGLLTYDPKQRLTAEQALKCQYFKELPLPIDPSMFPTWPAKSELGVRKALASSPKPPSGGSQFKQLGRDDNQIITSSTSTSQSIANNKTGFILNANIEQRQVAMAPGFNLKF